MRNRCFDYWLGVGPSSPKFELYASEIEWLLETQYENHLEVLHVSWSNFGLPNESLWRTEVTWRFYLVLNLSHKSTWTRSILQDEASNSHKYHHVYLLVRFLDTLLKLLTVFVIPQSPSPWLRAWVVVVPSTVKQRWIMSINHQYTCIWQYTECIQKSCWSSKEKPRVAIVCSKYALDVLLHVCSDQ